MATDLHYSPAVLLLRCGWILVATAVVSTYYVVHAGGAVPRALGLGFVSLAAIGAGALYLVAATLVMTVGLMRNGGVALSASREGVTIRTAWFAKTVPWADLSRINLDVRYGRSSHRTVIAVHEGSGAFRCHSVDTRLLAEPLDQVSDWIDAAEQNRVAHGGARYVAPTTGLAAYNAREQVAVIAADIAKAQQARAL